MIRALLLLVALVIIALIVAVWTGAVDLNQTRAARAPAISPGQTPAFDVQVNPITVGTTTTNVQVPAVKVETRQIEVPTVSTGGNQAAPAQ